MKALLMCYVCDSTTLQQRLCPRVWYVSNHWINSHCGKKQNQKELMFSGLPILKKASRNFLLASLN